MSDILIKWLNQEIHLSKEITNLSEDFKNGYLFAELLHKTKQLHNLSDYKNTLNKKDIIRNFCLLDQVFLRMGIILSERDRDEIMKGNIYTSKIYLLKIKQILDKKCINLEQLNHKYSNDLQKLYNSVIFKSNNEKYLYNLKIRTENEKNNMNKGTMSSRSLTEQNLDNIDNKYSKGGPVYLKLKKKYSHLQLSEFDLEILLLDMKEEEKKYKMLKQSIQKTETARKNKCQSKDKLELNVWKSSIVDLNKFKNDVLTELWKPVVKKQKNFKIYIKKQESNNIKSTENFDRNLNVFATDKIKEHEDLEDQEEKDNAIDLQKSLQMKNEVYMSQIKEKLEERIRSKKDKEKRERKRLREEREMYERMNTEKNMQEMISKMENNLSRKKKAQMKEGLGNVDNTQQLLNNLSPQERQRIRDVDGLVIKELNKQNKIDEEKNELEEGRKDKVKMNITKVIKKREKMEKEKEKEMKENQEVNEVAENNNEENKEENENIPEANKSSYSKLSSNDYGLNLMDEAFELHNMNNKDILNRMKLFKTRLLFNEDSEQKFNNLPKLFNLEDEENSNTKKEKEKPELKILTKEEKDKNKTDIFDKDLFYEEMDKLNYENFVKESSKRKIKKEKKINIIKPLLDKILDITDYVYDYQQSINAELIDNEKWDELMERFNNWEDIKDKEEEIVEEKKELSQYLFDYGYKLEFNDSLIMFDYTNYLSIFNDLIIPGEERGRKYKFCELYEEFYEPSKHNIDIKEYEPKEEEIENLTLPKYPNFINYKFYEIIENSFKNKYNKIERYSLSQNKQIEIFTQKGKYFYLPIKMSFIGYPLSGKKVQSNLISLKYPKIKIFNPEEIFENKLEEYKKLKEPVESSTKNKNLKPNQLEQLNKEREEKLEQFKPVLEIIKPYLDYLEEYNSSGMNLNLHETNFKEDILNDIYLNLLLYELNLAFPDDIESKNKLMEEIKSIYQEYLNIKEQIDEIKKKEEESMKELDDKNNKNKKVNQNFSKDLEALNKKIETVVQGLYIGFIFVNFPKNEIQAKKLENKISGFISEFEKPKDEITEKIFEYENLLDINIKQNNKNLKQISMFDLFVNLNISSEEVDRRFKISKYDPSTNKVYNMEENPPNDKKILEKLLPGIPGFDEKKLKEEKLSYEKNKSGVCNFYKMMSNGMENNYRNIDCMDKSNNNNINNNIENSMEKIIFENYCKNLDIINNIINEPKIADNSEEKHSDNNIEEKVESPIKIEENKEDNKEENKNEPNNLKITEETKMTNNNVEKNITENSNAKPKEAEISINIYNNSEDISNQFELFANDYQNMLTNFIHFLSRQKYHMEFYLTKIQEDFLVYLNRKTDKVSVAKIYCNKYNAIVNSKPHLLNNKRVTDELLKDIEDVAKSIWINIQSKKNDDIKYLTDLKESKKLNLELEKFWEFALKIFENEVKKYLITCEIIIKYYLNLIGYLPEIISNVKNNSETDKPDDVLFKVDYLKYLFQGIDNSDIINNSNFLEEEKKEEEIKEIKDDKEEKEEKMKKKGSKKDAKKDKLKILEEKENHDETKSNLTQTNKISNSSKKTKENFIEKNVNNLFINSLKIIIRQDLLMKQYKEKIKSYNPLENSKLNKSSVNKLNASIITTSSTKKIRMKNAKIGYEEEFSHQIQIEKNKFKYRLMFLKSYIIKYFNIIIECFNSTYNSMDDWIIMSVRNQNNTLNEFSNYLRKVMKKQNQKVDLDSFEFDYFDNYRRYKIDVSSILDKMNLNSYINLKQPENQKGPSKDLILLNISDMPYIDKFIYNINDLMQIYSYLKSFGNEGCDYLIKYETVKEILIHKFFAKRKYEIVPSNINNINPINLANEDNESKNTEKMNLFKNINKINFEENNGIPKAIKFLSNVNYFNCLDNFSEYKNNYININDLFTCLILCGSELITSDKFIENIKEQTKKENNILLSKEEFLNIKFWFDEDKYLNSFADIREEAFFKDEKNNINKIQKIKTSLFEINEDEGKVSLDKIINLLNKFDKNKVEEKSNEQENDDEQNESNREDKNKEKVEDNEQEKEQISEQNKEENENKEENNDKENEEKEKNQDNEEINIENKSNQDKDLKESVKNDEMSSPRNESELFSSSNKKFGKDDEIKNNFFNSIFYNQ